MEIRDKMARGDDGVLADVLKLLGEYYLIVVTQIINSVYGTCGCAQIAGRVPSHPSDTNNQQHI